MAKQKPSAAWTAICTEQDCEPVGPIEAAQRAINLLGPFKYRTRDEANRHEPPPNGSRIRVSQEFAVERVYVQEPVYDEFVSRLTAKVNDLRTGMDEMDSYGTDFGALANDRQMEIVERHVKRLPEFTGPKPGTP